jgi:N,N-dimethylformamidase beta subunit-like, C-terminal
VTLEAYCWPPSAVRGEAVGLRVSTDAPSFDVEVAREGAVREPVWSVGGVAARSHDTPVDASSTGCGWPPALEIPVGDWRSGYYSVTLTAGDQRADAFLVVRPDPSDPAPILLVLSTTTWHAYNDWGGPSLYTGGTHVSFERPFARGFLVKPEPIGRMMQPEPDREAMGFRTWARPLGLSDWCGGAGWFTYERTFTRWAEATGYRIDVAVSQDLERHPEVLEGPRLVLSVGHDEYWSWGMRDALDAFTERGGNAAVLSGNTSFWQVRFDLGHRGMTGYKHRVDEDPVLGTTDERLLTGCWSDHRIGRPETSTIGLTFSRGGYSKYGLGAADASGAYTVHRPDHWVFAATGLGAGREFGRTDTIVAYECDGCALESGPDGLPLPTGADGAPEGLEILATAPAHLWARHEQPSRYAHEPGDLEQCSQAVFGDASPEHLAELGDGHAVMAAFERPGGGSVLNVGVTDWVLGLDDPVVECITRNVLDRLSR